MAFHLQSPSIDQGEEIPKQFTGEGKDESPTLEWANEPEGTKELALVCEDPDAPRDEPWVHWLVYKIPGVIKKLPEATPNSEQLDLPPGVLQGTNSFGKVGYGGPMPPRGHGWHHYQFRLYALDSELNIKPGITKTELMNAMEGHVLGVAELMGRYKREEEVAEMEKAS